MPDTAGRPQGSRSGAPMPPDAAAVCDAYALGRPVAPPTFAARGELGRIWRLDTSTGTWAIKELFRPGPEDDARADVAFQSAAVAAGIPMPRPVIGRDGRVLATVATAAGDVTVRAYSWVDLARPVRAAAAADAAGILGSLHALAFPDDRAPDGWFTEPVAPGRWAAIVDRAAAAGAPWRTALEALVPEILAAEPVIRAGRHAPTIRCHLDFNRENVLADAAGRAVVVDWENAGSACAEQELASALAEFVPDPSGTAAFLSAYAGGGGRARLRDRASFAMTLAIQGNLVAWYAERALDATAPEEDRARSVHWLEEIAANAFTLARVDRWLSAANGYDVPRSSSHREDA